MEIRALQRYTVSREWGDTRCRLTFLKRAYLYELQGLKDEVVKGEGDNG